MSTTFRILFWLFLLLYVGAVIIWALGTFGLFGTTKDPLSGVFLVLLGQPWIRLVDLLPEKLWAYASLLGPAPTLLILYSLMRYFR